MRLNTSKAVLVGALVAILFVGCLEMAVRVWAFFFREQAEKFDRATKTFILLPGTYTGFGGQSFYVNRRGFVGEEFEDPVLPGTIRIVALGDSCTFGAGEASQTYPGQLEQKLGGRNEEHRYQVINAGIRGLNTELALHRFISKVLPLIPDIVIVYLGWNDLMKFEPWGQVEEPGIALLARLMDHLWVIKGMRKLIFYYVRPLVSSPATGRASRTGAFRDYRPAVLEGNLRQIIHVARGGGAKIIVTTLPTVVSDDLDQEDLRRLNVIFPYYAAAYAVGDFVDLIAAYNRAIRTVATSEGVSLVDLASEIDGRADRRELFFDTMHPNQRGRIVIAELLAPRIRELSASGRDKSR